MTNSENRILMDIITSCTVLAKAAHLRGGWWVRLLRELGLDPSGADATRAIGRVRANLTFEMLANRPYFDGETEPCIDGAILAVGNSFGQRCDCIVDRLLHDQLADGGWYCKAPPSTRSSFNSTIRVLEGLLEDERRWAIPTAVTDVRRL